jgi:hypothetical protein
MILAHREVDNEGNVLEQLLEEHLYKTGKRCGEIAFSRNIFAER